jgi:hypothetical protein
MWTLWNTLMGFCSRKQAHKTGMDGESADVDPYFCSAETVGHEALQAALTAKIYTCIREGTRPNHSPHTNYCD